MDDVVAVCGRPSLRQDDPIRREMITLARAAPIAVLKTPTSPIVLSKLRSGRGGGARGASRGQGATPLPAGRWRWVVVGAATVLLALGLWRVAPWLVERRAAPRGVTATDSVPAVAAAARPDSSAPAPRRTPVPPTRGAPVPAARRAADSVARAAAQRDDSLIRSLRASALAAQQRATDAGATPVDLGKGASAFQDAESLAASRRVSEAMMQFATAASLWGDAERSSRSRVPRDTEPRRAAEPAAPPPVPVATAPVDPRPDIEKVVNEYARALESGDLERVRHAYPGLTTAQQDSWRGFFDRVLNLKANLSITSVSVTGARADAVVSGVYEYDDTRTGRAERRPVTFRATLTKDASGWQLATIR
jgi:hypothetical protein